MLAALLVAATAAGCGGSGGKKDAAKPTPEPSLAGWTFSKLDAVLLHDVPGFRARLAPPPRTPTGSPSVAERCRDFADAADAAKAVAAFHDGLAACGHGVTVLDPALGDSSAGYLSGSLAPGRFGDIAVQVGTLTVGVQLVHEGATQPDAAELRTQLEAIARKQVDEVRTAGA